MDLIDLMVLFVYVSLCCMLVPVLIGFLSSIWQWIQEEWDKSRPRPDWRMRSKSPPQSNNTAAPGPNAQPTSQKQAPPPGDPDPSAPGWWWNKGDGSSSPTNASQIRHATPRSTKR